MKILVGTGILALSLMAAPAAFAKTECPMDSTSQTINVLPLKCQNEIDDWAAKQPDTSVDVQGDIAVGTVLPENVTIVDVPSYKHYGYVVVNKKRMLVDRNTRTVIKVY